MKRIVTLLVCIFCASLSWGQYINITPAQPTICSTYNPYEATLYSYWTNAGDGIYHFPNGSHNGSCNYSHTDMLCGQCQGAGPSSYNVAEQISPHCVIHTKLSNPLVMKSDCSANHGDLYYSYPVGSC